MWHILIITLYITTQFLFFFCLKLFSASRQPHIHVKGENTFGDLVTFKVLAQYNCLEVFRNNYYCHRVYTFYCYKCFSRICWQKYLFLNIQKRGLILSIILQYYWDYQLLHLNSWTHDSFNLWLKTIKLTYKSILF